MNQLKMRTFNIPCYKMQRNVLLYANKWILHKMKLSRANDAYFLGYFVDVKVERVAIYGKNSERLGWGSSRFLCL